MKLLMLILFFPFSFEGENGRELLDTALEKCSRLESLEACRDILYRYGVADRLPLSCPLKDKFRISSPYGGRIHPITGKHSFHSGVDMAGGAGRTGPCHRFRYGRFRRKEGRLWKMRHHTAFLRL